MKRKNFLYKTLEDFSNERKQKIKNAEEIREAYSFSNHIFCEENSLDIVDALAYKPEKISEEEKVFIVNMIKQGSYNDTILPYALSLIEKIDTENLYLLALNLSLNPQVEFVDSGYLPDNTKGKYDNKTNSIMLTNEEILNHEIFHLASSPFAFNQDHFRQSGFQFVYDDKLFGMGLNEGYTELLSRRYFSNDYKTESYTTNVYLLRLIELLYDDSKDMERDYFTANYRGPLNVFKSFASDEELEYLMNYLDWKALGIEEKNQENLMMEFMLDIVGRTNNEEKIDAAKEICTEYKQVIHNSTTKSK